MRRFCCVDPFGNRLEFLEPEPHGDGVASIATR